VDFDAIEADRLGIRGSIIARMSAVGGSADIRTGSHGTTVTVSWRAQEEPS
jgi:signal transduction histidine kinase